MENKEGLWIKKQGGIATIGVEPNAAKKVKEFVFIELPEKGTKVSEGEDLISLEAMKWSGHLKSPVTGEVVEVNQEVFEDPSKINEDPANTWIIKIKLEG